MFAELPENVKKLVLFHLHKNEFVEAKAIHDKWMRNHASALLALPAPQAPSSKLNRLLKKFKFKHFIIEFVSVGVSVIATGIMHIVTYLLHYHHFYLLISMMFSHVISWLSSSAIVAMVRRHMPTLPRHSLTMRLLQLFKTHKKI